MFDFVEFCNIQMKLHVYDENTIPSLSESDSGPVCLDAVCPVCLIHLYKCDCCVQEQLTLYPHIYG